MWCSEARLKSLSSAVAAALVLLLALAAVAIHLHLATTKEVSALNSDKEGWNADGVVMKVDVNNKLKALQHGEQSQQTMLLQFRRCENRYQRCGSDALSCSQRGVMGQYNNQSAPRKSGAQ